MADTARRWEGLSASMSAASSGGALVSPVSRAAHGAVVQRPAHREVPALQPAGQRVGKLLDPGLGDAALDLHAAGQQPLVRRGDGGDGEQIAGGDAVVEQGASGGGEAELRAAPVAADPGELHRGPGQPRGDAIGQRQGAEPGMLGGFPGQLAVDRRGEGEEVFVVRHGGKIAGSDSAGWTGYSPSLRRC
jgi:hypothetical protein